jgi:hypothetical protein
MDTGPLMSPYFILMTFATLGDYRATAAVGEAKVPEGEQGNAGQQFIFWSSAGRKYYSQTR